MKYLLVALLNGIYGVMTLATLTRETPGYYIIFVIALILSLVGIIGVIFYLIMVFSGSAREEKTGLLENWFQYAKNIDIVLIIGLLFRAFVLQPYIVDGNSMENNFHNNEYILVDQMTYRFRAPVHGEAIVFHPPIEPQTNFIKRIIGLPGETVVIENNTITINGHLLTESYTNPGGKTLTGQPLTVTLGSDEYFVMGDNREHSSDSREWGPVPRKNIVGRAWLVVYPTQDFGIVHNPVFSLSNLPLSLNFERVSKLQLLHYL